MIGSLAAAFILSTSFFPPSRNDGWTRSFYEPQQGITTSTPIIANSNISESGVSGYMPEGDMLMTRLDWLKSEIDAYGQLEEGWDGDSGVPPDEAQLSGAHNFLQAIPSGIPWPKPMLSHDGLIGFYWDDEIGIADAQVESENSYSLYIRNRLSGADEFHPEIKLGTSFEERLKDALNFIKKA